MGPRRVRVRSSRGRVRVASLAIWTAALILLGTKVGIAQTVAAGGLDTDIPQRIITISPSGAEIICELGAGDAIVAVSKFCVYPPMLQDRPRVGGLFDPNLEKIVALHPDLVVLRGRNESLEQLCESRGIPVYLDPTDRLADIATFIGELGRRLGKEKLATHLIARFNARLARIAKRVAGRQRPRVLVTVSRRPDRMANILSVGSNCFLSDMLEIAGAANVFGEVDMAYPQVSLESILTKSPEIIIEFMPEATKSDGLTQRVLASWRALGPMPATKHDRVHIMTEEHCLMPSLRFVEIVDKVSRLVHPEAKVVSD